MAETGVSLAYRAILSSLASSSTGITDAGNISSIINRLGLDPKITKNSLVRGGYLLPVHFRGIYHVPDPEELKAKFLKRKSFEIVAGACTHLFGRNWYYGLSSSLYFEGMQKQVPSEFFIITNCHLPSSFEFCGSKFRIRRLGASDYSTGIIDRGFLRFSSPARTITDYLYFYTKEGKQKHAISLAMNILQSSKGSEKGLDGKLTGVYPSPYNIAVAHAAKKACGGSV